MHRVSLGGRYPSALGIVLAALAGVVPASAYAASTTVYAFNTTPNSVYHVYKNAAPVATTAATEAGVILVTLSTKIADWIQVSLDPYLDLQPPVPPFFSSLESDAACALASWVPSGDPTVVGYVVSIGARSVENGEASEYDRTFDTIATSHSMCSLHEGRYYVAVQSKNFAGMKSAYSAERIVDIMTLPVLISMFEARHESGGVRLSWRVTADEVVQGYRLYRRDGDDPERRLFDDLLAPEATSYLDTRVSSAATYIYVLAAVKPGGDEVLSAPATVITPALETVLGQNLPNPFNPTTSIPFTLDAAVKVTLRVYDVTGALVKTLVDGNLGEGAHAADWAGTNGAGQPVASGTYFCVLTAGKRSLSRKMVLLK